MALDTTALDAIFLKAYTDTLALLRGETAAPSRPVDTKGTAQTGAALLAYAREGLNIWGEAWVDADTLAARKASLPRVLASYPAPGHDPALVEVLHLLGLDGDIEYTTITADQYVSITLAQQGKASGGR